MREIRVDRDLKVRALISLQRSRDHWQTSDRAPEVLNQPFPESIGLLIGGVLVRSLEQLNNRAREFLRLEIGHRRQPIAHEPRGRWSRRREALLNWSFASTTRMLFSGAGALNHDAELRTRDARRATAQHIRRAPCRYRVALHTKGSRCVDPAPARTRNLSTTGTICGACPPRRSAAPCTHGGTPTMHGSARLALREPAKAHHALLRTVRSAGDRNTRGSVSWHGARRQC